MVRQSVRWWKALENVAGISNYLSLLDLWNEFRALGCHLVQSAAK